MTQIIEITETNFSLQARTYEHPISIHIGTISVHTRRLFGPELNCKFINIHHLHFT